MNNVELFFKKNKKCKNAAIFLSGSGTNAIKVLDYWKAAENPEWKPVVLITDAPDKSKAKEIAGIYNIPIISHDIRKFYIDHGHARISILTTEGQIIREKWTNELRSRIADFDIDFGILAGFVPLTNITSDFPCLNIHPGDLTIEKNGKRLLVGLHTIPIELAIVNKLNYLRSSVIIAQPYSGKGEEMDSGPILGISPKIFIDFKSFPRDYLTEIYMNRPLKRPAGGFKDELEEVAKHNQELLKIGGDWIVFPRVVNDFAKNNFALDKENNLLYKVNNNWESIKTVVYHKNIKKIFDKKLLIN